jgi:hypothetical protein
MSSKHSANPHTVEILKANNFSAQTVEHRKYCPDWKKPYKYPKEDLFNMFDVLALRSDLGVFGIQATDAADTYKHRAKMLSNPVLKIWLQTNCRA